MLIKTQVKQPNCLDYRSKLLQKFYKVLSSIPLVPSLNRYNLTISYTKKFVWFRVAKVGTRTIYNHLQKNNVRLDVAHASYIHYPPHLFIDFYKFAFVRNPWDRLASCWRDKVVNQNYFQFNEHLLSEMQDFNKFIDFVTTLDISRCDRHLRLQSALIDLTNLSYLGRMESFEHDYRNIMAKLRISTDGMELLNATQSKQSYREYYSSEAMDKVAKVYRKDIQLFGYEF